MRLVKANISDLDDIRWITQTTIMAVYPKYYPAGAVEFFSKHHSDEKIKADIEAGYVYILEDEGKGVGTVTVSGNHINRLFVLPECQHKGYGRYMMDFAEEKIAKEHKTIELDASFPAKRIYLKRGYKEIEYNTIETDNGDKLCYDVMVKEVT
ncbi:MAG: GNAT family N-acetyltransferase [Clostridiales bacterium]|nr:GNAT family N-acetyltransferase [Clostridiales bacterium]MBR5359115.1 GNAT family N-acetyltransferase [Clostridiales bacterium]